MTAANVIDEIKLLPPTEQAQVVRFAIELARPRLFNLEPWDSNDLAKALQDDDVDRDYPIDAMIRAQSFPRD